MAPRTITYRGFMLTVSRRSELGWCVRYESINGEVVRQSYGHATEGEAVEHAESKIDSMIHKEDRQQPDLRPWTKSNLKG